MTGIGRYGMMVAILAAILFPVFVRAQEKARIAGCQSNLKELALADAGGAAQGTQTLALAKFPAARGSKVEIDRDQMVVLVEGKPFFPMGLIRVPAEAMKECAEAGFNTVVSWIYHDPIEIEDGRKYLDAAQAAGLKVVEGPGWYTGLFMSCADPELEPKFKKGIQETLPQVIEAFKDHPALLAWYSPDEPNLLALFLPDKEQGAIRLCRDYYRVIKERDPYHPVYQMHSGSLATAPGWSETYDIGGMDPYWCAIRGRPPLYVAHKTQETVAVTTAQGKPTWMMPVAGMYGGSGRSLTPQEQRCQTYLALIHGAKGLLYYIYTFAVQYRPLWEELKVLAGEVKQLSPILVTADPPQEITVSPERLREAIHVVAKWHKGRLFLITANATPVEATVSFRLPAVTATKAKVWFEKRNLRMSGGGFSDRYAPYASHVYEIGGRINRPARVELEVALKPGKAAEQPPEVFVPPTENLVKNAGFEEDGGWTSTQSNRGMKGVFDAESHSGGRSLKLEQTDSKSWAKFTSDPIKLDPDTRYRLGAYIRSDFSEGYIGPRVFLESTAGRVWGDIHFVSTDGSGRIAGGLVRLEQMKALLSDQSEWKHYSANIVTGGQPVTVRVCCLFGGALGVARFDDVFLVKVPPTEVVNLLQNSSFEETANPGWPDLWRRYRGAVPTYMWFPEKGADWVTDDQVAFHGKQSLRMTREGPASDDSYRLLSMGLQQIPVVGDREYTFSIYLKADRAEVPVRLIVRDEFGAYPALWTDVHAGTEWKQYSLTSKLHPKQWLMRLHFHLMGPGTIWADAAQFEIGGEAHPYVPE